VAAAAARQGSLRPVRLDEAPRQVVCLALIVAGFALRCRIVSSR